MRFIHITWFDVWALRGVFGELWMMDIRGWQITQSKSACSFMMI